MFLHSVPRGTLGFMLCKRKSNKSLLKHYDYLHVYVKISTCILNVSGYLVVLICLVIEEWSGRNDMASIPLYRFNDPTSQS